MIRRPATLRLAAPTVLTGAATLLSACGSSGDAAQDPGGGGSSRPGGTLTFAVGSDQGCADPQQVASNDSVHSLRQIALGALGEGYLSGYAGTTVVDDLTARVTFKQPNARPGDIGEPYVSVSADVVVADDEAPARELATGYGLWVRSICTAEGAIPFPTPEEARRHAWTEEDRELVADRVDTQFIGSAAQVADQLEVLRDPAGADELIITTITHDHADRVRSYRLLAEEWARRS